MGEILRGKYEIAFFTYDKFLGISAAAPYILNQRGLVVPDEAQFVTDPGPGMVVELLLTSLVSAKQRGVSPQLVAQLFRRYVQGNPEPIRSSFNDGNPATWVIRLLAPVIAGALLSAGFTIPEIFLFVGLVNAVVAFYIFLLVPEYLLRFVAWIITRCVYRFKVTGDDNIPTTGAAILACNHVSFIDAVLLLAASPRPIYFVMEHRIFRIPVLGALFRLAKAIPIAPRAEDPEAYEAALAAAQKVLRAGDLLAIFPQGGLTLDGKLQEFKGGIMKILEREPVPVIPMALTNLWGSYFSRVEQGDAMVRPFRRGMFSRVGLRVGTQLPPHEVRPDVSHTHTAGLLARA